MLRNTCTHVNYVFTRRRNLKYIQNVKIIGEEESIPKYVLVVVCKTNLKAQKRKHKLTSKRRIWKLSKPEVQASYKKAVEEAFSFILLSDPEFEAHIEPIWTKIKSRLIKDQCLHHIETSQKIGRANQLTMSI